MSPTLYTCTTDTCSERFRGFTDEPGLWCSVCLEDLTAIGDSPLTVDEANALAERTRPLPEGEVA